MNIKTLSLLCIIVLSLTSICHAQSVLSFTESKYNFGKIPEEGGKVKKVFSFRNAGDQFISISNVKTSCGCTVPSWPQGAIAPGDTGSIEVTYNPMYRTGLFEKTATLLLSDETEYPLTIMGEVTPREKGLDDFYPFAQGNLWFKQSTLIPNSFYSYHDTLFTVENSVYNASTGPIEIDWNQCVLPEFMQIDTQGRQIIPAGDSLQFSVKYDVRLRNEWGAVSDTFQIYTNDVEVPVKTLRVVTIIQERFNAEESHPKVKLDNTEIYMGELSPGIRKKTSIELHNGGNRILHIRKVISSYSDLSIDYPKDGILPGESASLEISLKTPISGGPLLRRFALITNDPKHSELHIIIQADILHEPSK